MSVNETHVLNELFTDKDILWQIHNCKLLKDELTHDGSMPFLYHYDALDEELKKDLSLTPELLKRFATKMTTTQAYTLLGLDISQTPNPWYVKLVGSLVVYHEPLQLAIKLQWQNTSKDSQPIYTKTKQEAIKEALQNWHFFGSIYVLNKHPSINFLVLDEDENAHTISFHHQYQKLNDASSIALLNIVNHYPLPIFQQAIEQRVLT